MLELNVEALLEIIRQQGYTCSSLSRAMKKPEVYISYKIHLARKGSKISLTCAQEIARQLGTDVSKFTRWIPKARRHKKHEQIRKRRQHEERDGDGNGRG